MIRHSVRAGRCLQKHEAGVYPNAAKGTSTDFGPIPLNYFAAENLIAVHARHLCRSVGNKLCTPIRSLPLQRLVKAQNACCTGIRGEPFITLTGAPAPFGLLSHPQSSRFDSSLTRPCDLNWQSLRTQNELAKMQHSWVKSLKNRTVTKLLSNREDLIRSTNDLFADRKASVPFDRRGTLITCEGLMKNRKSNDAQTNNRSLRPLIRLVPYLSRHKKMAAAALMALVAAAAITLILPTAIRRMIDFGFGADDPALINAYFFVLIGVVAGLAAASSIRYFLVMWIGERIVAEVRADVFAHMTQLSPAFYDSAKSGEILSRLTADTTQIKSAFGASASVALRNFMMFAGASIMMVVTSQRLSLIVLAAIPVIIIPLIGFGRSVRKRSRSAQDTLAEATAYASEMLGGVRTLQAFTNEEFATNRFRGAVEKAFRTARQATAARAILTGFAILVIGSSIVAVLWIGASDVFAGRMTGGQLSQFLLYSILAAGSLASLSEVWGELSQAAGAAERLSELLDIRPDIAAPANPVPLPKDPAGQVVFDAVSFAYKSAEYNAVIEGLDLVIEPGETVAIVGPSGAGKSTLFHLLMRFYDPDQGNIRINGADLRRMDPAEFRKAIALVPQDTVIFGASVAENIAYGQRSASKSEIEAAAEAALAYEFVSRMPDGFDTLVGERGVTLSGGQRQRIAIARAILKNAPILLLDEATSALDAESEYLVQKALDRLMQGRTTLVIAHRLATVLKADRIVVMENGRVVETGTHDELVTQAGVYSRLSKLQFDTARIGAASEQSLTA
ncbi:ATP-binding cassette subfamily B protein [Roseibium hamelinense]|uniref:ATP-binding cassette subfamily B protein n=2 Tax=Roseibium hamelinense TaxID=150831 RepID=A0A562SM14_9HYPH|nr:ATP-binding cassette subfamily B protein [Roseibium hamelinense]